MGVDWIPCRVEAGCPTEELCELVRREALHFRTNGCSMASGLDPRHQFSDDEREMIRQAYLELGPLHRRLLLKRESHRVSVITSEVLFPIEWRIAAERTILPWEVRAQLEAWRSYREDVQHGGHRAFIQQLYIYACLHELVTVDQANFISVVRHSLTTTSSWAHQPAVVACRDQVLAAPILVLPSPPDWPAGGAESDPAAVEDAFTKIETVVKLWNQAVQRGNVRLRPPRRPLPFDHWVAARLNDAWFSSFLAWVEPWACGGYGLYRDCE